MRTRIVHLINYKQWDCNGHFLKDEVYSITVEGFDRLRAAVAFFKECYGDVEIQSAKQIHSISLT